MSGIVAIRYLLANNAPLLAVVPAARIIVGDLPLNFTLPAISITQVDSLPRLTLAMTEPKRMHTDRVQVTALIYGPQGTPAGLGLPGLESILKLVLNACPNQRGMINGVDLDSILPDVKGPLLQDDVSAIYSGSRDFIVRWNSAT